MADRYELEQKIYSASWIIEDLHLLRQRIDGGVVSADLVKIIDNYLIGLVTIYRERFNDLEDTFVEVFDIIDKQQKETKKDPTNQPYLREVDHKFFQQLEMSRHWKPYHTPYQMEMNFSNENNETYSIDNFNDEGC